MNRTLDLLISLGLVILTLGIVVYALIALKVWGSDFQIWFFRAGDIQSVIMISIGIIVVGLVLKKLLIWEIHAALGPKKRGRR